MVHAQADEVSVIIVDRLGGDRLGRDAASLDERGTGLGRPSGDFGVRNIELAWEALGERADGDESGIAVQLVEYCLTSRAAVRPLGSLSGHTNTRRPFSGAQSAVFIRPTPPAQEINT